MDSSSKRRLPEETKLLDDTLVCVLLIKDLYRLGSTFWKAPANRSDTIQSVKERIFHDKGVPIDQQRFTFYGLHDEPEIDPEIVNSSTLESYREKTDLIGETPKVHLFLTDLRNLE